MTRVVCEIQYDVIFSNTILFEILIVTETKLCVFNIMSEIP